MSELIASLPTAPTASASPQFTDCHGNIPVSVRSDDQLPSAFFTKYKMAMRCNKEPLNHWAYL